MNTPNNLCVKPDPSYLAISVASMYSSYHLCDKQRFPLKHALLLLSVQALIPTESASVIYHLHKERGAAG